MLKILHQSDTRQNFIQRPTAKLVHECLELKISTRTSLALSHIFVHYATRLNPLVISSTHLLLLLELSPLLLLKLARVLLKLLAVGVKVLRVAALEGRVLPDRPRLLPGLERVGHAEVLRGGRVGRLAIDGEVEVGGVVAVGGVASWNLWRENI